MYRIQKHRQTNTQFICTIDKSVTSKFNNHRRYLDFLNNCCNCLVTLYHKSGTNFQKIYVLTLTTLKSKLKPPLTEPSASFSSTSHLHLDPYPIYFSLFIFWNVLFSGSYHFNVFVLYLIVTCIM